MVISMSVTTSFLLRCALSIKLQKYRCMLISYNKLTIGINSWVRIPPRTYICVIILDVCSVSGWYVLYICT